MKTLLLLSLLLLCDINLSAQEIPIQKSQLPREAQAFLKEHFKSGFHHAIKEVNERVILYDVFLNDNTEIEFNESGRWIKVDGKGQALPVTFLQKQTLDYVKIKYPAAQITKIERSASVYKLELSNKIDLKFDAVGTFIKAD
ncbi:hypothetical protein CHU92_06895 [Flavobacterium cyanobacteriorum]|uniref:Putative beta-lactamase-inhibitor-like PepSY-like domain-containing protein n=1 Tax=Flavobacterium cyanobacteriorum TaxID=2022802 RepID=A0A255Z8Z5_9FLAO|nr:PepSY-like domain-containing protein [Flavobacterium cyanobacteriorum]OYQ38023.1 hypothetical protein CHU92_06895 [Flavobacterium cyanobacteriorum]